MTLRSAVKRHFADLVAHAPYRPPPAVPADEQGRVDLRDTVWALGCAAVLALMLVLSGVGGGRPRQPRARLSRGECPRNRSH
jgi:hypothetical protein